MKQIAPLEGTGDRLPISTVSCFRQVVLALVGSLALVNSASAQAPGLLWSTNIGANLFALGTNI